MPNDSWPRRLTTYASYAAVFLLVFIWSIPHTIALRYVLLCAVSLLALCTCPIDSSLRRALPVPPLLAFGLFAAWLVTQAIFVSGETAWALRELKSQYLPALVACAIGILFGRHDVEARDGRGSALWTGIALVFALQSAIAVGQSAWHWWQHGELLRQIVPLTGGKLEMSYIINILLTILSVDLFCRISDGKTFLRLPLAGTLTCLAFGMGASYLAGSRNGVIGIALLTFTAIALFLISARTRLGTWKVASISAALVIAVSGFAIASYKADPRWQVFAETARIAIDIDKQQAWYDPVTHPLPLLNCGKPVDESAYLRIAWLAAGVRVAGEIPWGVGYGRNAFARALKQQHYDTRVGHSHSGFIDLLAGAGIPAVLLWLAFIGTLITTGWRAFSRLQSPDGLLLILLTAGYTGRMLIESVSRDHMLQIFFFLTGVLLPLALSSGKTSGARGREQA